MLNMGVLVCIKQIEVIISSLLDMGEKKLILRQFMTQVRRTRISERMKKLQDLVPNMDKV